MRLRFVLILLLWIGLAAPADAQPVPVGAPTILDPAAPPDRTIALAPGFMPDPLRTSAITGGGEIDVNGRGLGENCVGFIGSAPDVRVDVAGALPLLRFIFMADSIFTDTTLVVRDPSGRFACGNNTGGLFNPLADIAPAPPGTYAVWIGGFTPGTEVFGALYVTTNPAVLPGSTDISIPLQTAVPTPTGAPVDVPLALMATPVPVVVLDAALPAQHGAATLENGFLPDPFWAVIAAGGDLAVPADLDAQAADPINASVEFGALVPADTCSGFTDAAPDYRLNWSGTSTRLRLHLVAADSANDTGLIVRTPEGRFVCNHDFASGFFNPSVEFVPPAAGEYTIWATRPLAGGRIPAVLYVTELPTTPETTERTGTPVQPDVIGLGLNPGIAQPITVGGEGLPDPAVLTGIFAGGTVDVAALNPRPDPNQGCEGFVTFEPTAAVLLASPQPFVRIFAIGEEAPADAPPADATLIVRMPDGRWYCDDDTDDTLHPTIDVIGSPVAGTALVWVGSFDPAGTFARLYVSTGGGASVTTPDALPRFGGLAVALTTAFVPTPMPLAASPALDAIAYALTVTPPLLDASLYIATPPGTPGSILTPDSPLPSLSGAAQTVTVPPAPAPLDAAAPANYGDLTGAGQAQGIAGGPVEAAVVLPGCAGFITAAPDVRVQRAGGAFYIRFQHGLGDAPDPAQTDSVLIVRRPDGAFVCNDDAFGAVDPYIEIADGLPGTYTVWIGSFTAGAAIPGLLTVGDL